MVEREYQNDASLLEDASWRRQDKKMGIGKLADGSGSHAWGNAAQPMWQSGSALVSTSRPSWTSYKTQFLRFTVEKRLGSGVGGQRTAPCQTARQAPMQRIKFDGLHHYTYGSRAIHSFQHYAPFISNRCKPPLDREYAKIPSLLVVKQELGVTPYQSWNRGEHERMHLSR